VNKLDLKYGKKMKCSICGSDEHTNPTHGRERKSYKYQKRGVRQCSICGAVDHYAKWHKQEVLESITEKKCSICGETKAICLFSRQERKHMKDGRVYLSYHSACKVCMNKKANERKDKEVISVDKALSTIFKRIETNKRNFVVDVDLDYLKQLYDDQDGKCFYSGIAMETSGSNCVSPDRIDSSIGYTKGNVVLCLNAVNYMKNHFDMESFLNICSQIHKKWNDN
jgi:hypothetical protein